MRKFFLILAASALALQMGAQALTEEQMVSLIRERPSRAACGHNPYEEPHCTYTPAPAGYKAFYVSHMGRHGSRYQTKESSFRKVLPILDTLSREGLLTACGDSLYKEIWRMSDAHKGNLGLLTQKGGLEHAGIALRLAQREPDIFRRDDAKTVYCVSTSVPRVIQSMANFGTALKGAEPSLDLIYHIGLTQLPEDAVKVPKLTNEEKESMTRPLKDSLIKAFPYSRNIYKRLFKDTARAAEITGSKRKFSILLLTAAQGYACLDIDVNPFRFFTAEELEKYTELHNVGFAVSYGGFKESNPVTMHSADKYLRAIVRDADAAIEGNGRCADLRFAHDGNVGPLLALIAPSGSEVDVPMNRAFFYWQSFSRICMATNLQMVFYRNASGDVLVKILRNEEEVTIPSLQTVSGVFHRWPELREYFLRRMGDSVDVPSYWTPELKSAAAQIRRLQKNEADGFFFWTDAHYPENNGKTPALICSLNSQIEGRRVFFGGDMAANRDDFVSALFPQFQAMEQLRGCAEFYPMRGNHDIVTRTKPLDAPAKAKQQWKVAEFFRNYTSAGAVYNPSEQTTCYYYFDVPASGLRYIVFDTSDSVKGSKVKYGISPSQMRWIVEKAIMGAPAGYRIVILSHIPFVNEKKVGCEDAGEMVAALKNHGVFEYGGIRYDFSKRKDLSVLFVLSGHRHRDMFFPEKGFPQIVSEADTSVQGGKVVKEAGDAEEQAFDYVSISRDFKTVTLFRIGHGQKRVFDLCAGGPAY